MVALGIHDPNARSFLRRVTATFPVLVVLAIAILSASQASAQVTGATLSGTVTDPSGAAIANAQVSILNKATGVTSDVTSDSAGLYSAPNLLPGQYDVTVKAANTGDEYSVKRLSTGVVEHLCKSTVNGCPGKTNSGTSW